MREFVLFQQQGLPNIYVVPSHASAFKWYGVIFIHHGLYQGTILRFTLLISPDYPSHEHPKLIFDTVPFHPLVNPKTGELNISKAFPLWNPNVNHLWQVIQLAKKIFYTLEKDLEDENEYASIASSHDLCEMFRAELVKMYKEDPEKFQHRIAETVAECHAKIYEPPMDSADHNAIFFGPWNPQLHEDFRQKLLSGDRNVPLIEPDQESPRGLSWVQKDSLKMFSKSAS